jgi:UDP-glucose 4-epimerase
MDSTTQNILITGGAGFIGSELVRKAAAAGFRVRIVDNLVNGKRANIEDALGDRVDFVEADIRDLDRMKVLLAGVDRVYHLACLGVRHSIHSPRENHDVNATATLDLLALSREAGVKRLVYVSSSEIYGTAHQVPITEETPAFPHTVYGSSKLAGDCYARAYWDTYRFPTTVVRPFNSYGPRCHHEGDSGEVIPKFILRALAGKPLIIFGDGSQTRDFMYVEETAHWILQAGLREETVGQTINLGTGVEIPVRDLARKVLAATERPDGVVQYDAPRPGDVLRLWADSGRIRRLLDFSPRIDLDEGLQRLVAWYQEQGIPPEKLLEDEVVHNWEGPA